MWGGEINIRSDSTESNFKFVILFKRESECAREGEKERVDDCAVCQLTSSRDLE